MKHLKHPKHLKHLKHFLWMPGLLFCQHFKELGGKVKDGVHRRQHQKGMFLLGGAWWDGREQKVTVDVFYMQEPWLTRLIIWGHIS